MFIHIGGDTMVRLNEVIGIFDIRLERGSTTHQLFERIRSENKMEVVDVGVAKSFVLTEKKVYLSPISSATLKKRASIFDTVERIKFH